MTDFLKTFYNFILGSIQLYAAVVGYILKKEKPSNKKIAKEKLSCTQSTQIIDFKFFVFWILINEKYFFLK